MRKSVLVAAALATVCATSAFALDNGPTTRTERWDFSVQTRYVASETIDGDAGVTIDLADDLGWGFGFGYNANEKFNIGFLLNWRNTDYTATPTDGGALTDSLSYSSFLESSTIALSADWNVLPKKFTPYVSGAIGYTIVSAAYSEDAASYSLGAGLRLELSDAFFFKVGYEYNRIDYDNAVGHDILRIDGALMIQ